MAYYTAPDGCPAALAYAMVRANPRFAVRHLGDSRALRAPAKDLGFIARRIVNRRASLFRRLAR